MLRFLFHHVLPERQKPLVKLNYCRVRKAFVDTFFSYSSADLLHALTALGVQKGDCLFVHSSFSVLNGFRGGPADVLACLLAAVGPEGTVLMPSMAYRSSTFAYLTRNEPFDVRRTPSRMGLVTELFRRRKDVVRSLNPAHPVLAAGRDAAWYVHGHELCLYSCGRNSPFDKLRRAGGKTLFFDVPFDRFTFIHHIEDLLRDRYPFPLYRRQALSARVIDQTGTERIVNTFAFSEETIRTRRPHRLEESLAKKSLLKRSRIGRTTLMLVAVEDAVQCAVRMIEQGTPFFAGDGDER